MSMGAYRPRRAWESPLYHAVAENLETFIAGRPLQGHPVPFFVVRDFRAFLDCVVPAHGFLRVYCEECGRDRVVPFSSLEGPLGRYSQAPRTTALMAFTVELEKPARGRARAFAAMILSFRSGEISRASSSLSRRCRQKS